MEKMAGRLVKALAERGCITVKKDTSIPDLVSVLEKYNIGSVVVVDEDTKPIGIVSERDIVRKYNLNALTIEEIMNDNIITCDLSTSSSELMELMNKYRIRHIPILENKNLIGIVSIGDVVKRLIEIYETENTNLKSFINS